MDWPLCLSEPGMEVPRQLLMLQPPPCIHPADAPIDGEDVCKGGEVGVERVRPHFSGG